MDRNESLYFDEFSKKSLSEIQEMFQNLKHIGMSDEDIDKYAKQYKEFFESRVKATGYQHIDGEKNSTFSEVSTDQVLTDLSQSVVSQHSSS
jgi:hypothetical protein